MTYPIYRYDIKQNSEEWLDEKIGMFSASPADKLLSDKGTKGYKELISKIAEERITGKRSDRSVFGGNRYTDRGHEFEPIARDDFEFRTLNPVKLVGVVIKDEWSLCSPDGLIYEDTLHQIKCPIFSTQEEYLELAKTTNDPKKIIGGSYYKQSQFELYVTGREVNIWTAFHPHLRALDIEIVRDSEMLDMIHDRITEAKEEVLARIERIKNL